MHRAVAPHHERASLLVLLGSSYGGGGVTSCALSSGIGRKRAKVSPGGASPWLRIPPAHDLHPTSCLDEDRRPPVGRSPGQTKGGRAGFAPSSARSCGHHRHAGTLPRSAP